MDERQLLARYLREHSSEAYGEIVRQNVDLVYAAARRQLQDSHLAEDVTQAVFVLFARKAASIRTPLGGWLIKATHYACRNARRIAARRDYHERQAMRSRLERAVPDSRPAESPWEEYRPFVDEALAQMTTADRDALTLRYLKGLALREVGAAQYTSEEAARKRIDRALIRLRQILLRRTAAPAIAVLAAGLAAGAAEAAPVALSHTITAAAGHVAAGAAVDLLAKAAASTFWMLKAKMAALSWAVFIAVILAAGAIATIAAVSHLPHSPQAAMPVAATSPGSNPDEDEAKVPGLIQVARWDVVLTQAGVDIVDKALHGVESKSVFYTASTANGVELRRAVRQAIAAGGTARVYSEMQFGLGLNQEKSIQDDSLQFYYKAEVPSQRIRITGGANIGNDELDRIDANNLHVSIHQINIYTSISELTDQWRSSPSEVSGAKAIVYNGDVAAGDAVAFVGKYVAYSGTPYYQLVVWETFKAQPQQMAGYQFGAERDAGWWCENGPARLRQWADASLAWDAQAAHGEEQIGAAFQKKLEDGKILRLEALCRPARWPYCWWDAEGKPLAGQDAKRNHMIPFHGDPPAGLWAIVSVSSDDPEENKRDNPAAEINTVKLPPEKKYKRFFCEPIDDASAALSLGVAVGAWKQIAELRLDESQTIHGVGYTLTLAKANPIFFRQFLVHFTRTGLLDNDDLVIPTAGDGSAAHTRADPILVFHHVTEPRRLETQPNYGGLSLGEVKTWRLMQRKRQWVALSHFAKEPKNLPVSASAP